MKTLNYLLFFLLVLNIPTFSQTDLFNLKNLDSLSIRFDDGGDLLSSTIKQKMITETKLKLKSAGIKTVQDNSRNYFTIRVRAIISNFAAHRILLQILISENVQTFRKDSIKTNAYTYYDESFFKSKNIGDAVYSEYMDKLLIRFIERFLTVN